MTFRSKATSGMTRAASLRSTSATTFFPASIPRARCPMRIRTRASFPAPAFRGFGDEIELLVNATNHSVGDEDSAGHGSLWQMVRKRTKSRKGEVGAGGLLEDEPRSVESASNM